MSQLALSTETIRMIVYDCLYNGINGWLAYKQQELPSENYSWAIRDGNFPKIRAFRDCEAKL